MKTVIYGQLTKKQLGTIKPLWEELNEIHFDDSVYFKDHFLAMEILGLSKSTHCDFFVRLTFSSA